MKRQVKVSVVIPAYNEARYLAICLEALLRQTVKPFEIIVVDNNSTDQTALIAHRYAGVTVLREPHQGTAAARTRGFDAARGDVIARLDADARPSQTWVAHLTSAFENSDCAAATGPVEDLPLGVAGRWVRELFAHRYNQRLAGHTMLFGANMALRRSAWRAIREHVCLQADIHEDLDLAIHLSRAGYQIRYDRQLVMKTASRRYSQSPQRFFDYLMLWPRTFARHNLRGVGQLTLMMYGLLAAQVVVRPLFMFGHFSHELRVQTLVKRTHRTAGP